MLSEEVITEINAWIEKAENDFKAIELLLPVEDAPMDVVCFHAQQGAEKYLKALLIAHGVPFPKIQDVKMDLRERLTELCRTTADSVKFAELKAGICGVLFAVISIALWYSLRGVSEYSNWTWGLVAGAVFFSVSSMLCICSVLDRPDTQGLEFEPMANGDPRWILATQTNPQERSNLFSVRDVRKYNPQRLISAMRHRYGIPTDSESECIEDLDLAAVAIANARSSEAKSRWIRTAAWFALLGVILMLIIAGGTAISRIRPANPPDPFGY